MSANAVISNLQQAGNCSSKCDCCRNLQSQLNQLKAEIKTIPRINEKAIIEKTEASLFPRIEGLVLPLINFKINPIKAVQTKQLANQKALLERVFKAESAARTAGTAANAAKSTAVGAGAKAGAALAKVAALALTIAGLVGVAATIKLLESRSNGIEKQVDSVGRDLSKAFGFIFQNRQKIETNRSNIKSNKGKIADVNDTAYNAQFQATQAREIGQKAQSTANQANQKSKENFDLIKPLQVGLSAVILQINGILPRLLNLEKTAKRSQNIATKALVEVQKPKPENDVNKSEVDKILARINSVDKKVAAIPGLVTPILPAVRNIPNSSAFKKSVSGATCSTLNSEPCTRRLRNSIGERIGRGNNRLGARFDRAINSLNLGASGVQLSLLHTINTKLGAPIPGGIGGKLTKLVSWLQLDRALNLLTTAATIHNAAMLSNNIAGTLGQGIANILSLVGIKDENGSPLNIGNIINGTVENLIKTVIGEANYIALNATWSKANRIYQAGINIVNTFQNLTNSVLNGLEVTAGRVGKIGNALRKAGEVLENAYGWMNPQPKFNGILGTLEKFDETANSIVQVTQAPLDIIQAQTELTNANTEFIKALKEDDKPTNKGIAEEQPQQLTQEQQLSKNISQGILTTVSDFFSSKD